LNNQSNQLILEDFDYSIMELIDNDMNIFCNTNAGWSKVPVLFSSPERSFSSKNKEELRDNNGTLIFPIISITRDSIKKPKQRSSIYGFNIPDFKDHKKNSVLISTEINHEKTNLRTRLKNKKLNNSLNHPSNPDKIVYNLKYVKQPSTLEITYTISIKCNFVQQMNQILSSFLTYTNNINYVTKIRNQNKFEIFLPEDNNFSNTTKDLEEEERFVETDFSILIRGHIIGASDNSGVPNVVIRESCPDIKFGLELSGEKNFSMPRRFQIPKIENRIATPFAWPFVTGILRDQNDNLIIRGIFDHVNNQPRRCIAYLNKFGDVINKDFELIHSGFSPFIYIFNNKLLISHSSLTGAGGVAVNRLCYFDLSDFSCKTFAQNIDDGQVFSVVTDSQFLYLGGSFTNISGNTIVRLCRYFLSDLTLDTTFNLNINNTVNYLLIDNNILYIGGSFSTVLDSTRRSFAAYDLVNNILLPYNPSLTGGNVTQIEKIQNSFIVCGSFNTVNTFHSGGLHKTRRVIAKFSTLTDINNEENWDQSFPSGAGYSFVVNKGYIYVFGSFNTVNSLSRKSLCRLLISQQNSVDFYQEDISIEKHPSSTLTNIQIFGVVDMGSDFLLYGDFVDNELNCVTRIKK
jgi:hypothetical protein